MPVLSAPVLFTPSYRLVDLDRRAGVVVAGDRVGACFSAGGTWCRGLESDEVMGTEVRREG
jgi:hypothetical protein